MLEVEVAVLAREFPLGCFAVMLRPVARPPAGGVTVHLRRTCDVWPPVGELLMVS